MKYGKFSAVLAAALMLTGCGSTLVENPSPETESSLAEIITEITAAETIASETTATETIALENKAAEMITTEPTSVEEYEFEEDLPNESRTASKYQSPYDRLWLGMTLSEVREVLGQEDEVSDGEPTFSIARAMVYDFNVDTLTLFGETYDIKSSVSCTVDDHGYLCSVGFNLGLDTDLNYYYSSDAERQADKDKLYAAICARAGEPDKVLDWFDYGDVMYYWYEDDLTDCWLAGCARMWNANDLCYNVIAYNFEDAEGNPLSYADVLAVGNTAN